MAVLPISLLLEEPPITIGTVGWFQKTILNLAYPYLGTIYSASVDWTPLKNNANLFGKWDGVAKSSDPWQFENFLLD